MKFGDYAILALSLLVIAAFSFFASRHGNDGGYVEVRVEDTNYIYPLDEDRLLEFEGPLGTTRMEIRDGRARFTESPCRDKVCITMGWIENQNDWAACLPNRIIATVRGTPDDAAAPDAVAR